MAGVGDVPLKDRPLSEQFRVAAKQWADANQAAELMEELKTTTLSKMKNELIGMDPKMSDAKAERLAKCDPKWTEYVREMCACRAKADRLKLTMTWLKMKHSEFIGADANARHEHRLNNGHA